MTYVVFFTPEAQDQLVGLYRHIAATASPDIAARYTDAIVTYCDGFGTFPQRGSCRDDIRPGLRITSFRRRVVIAFTLDPQQVSIIGIFYGGQDHETDLALEANDGELTP